MVRIAMDLLREGMIDEKTVLMRMEPQKLDELLTLCSTSQTLQEGNGNGQGSSTSPGAAAGQIVFQADEAEAWAEKKKESCSRAYRDISRGPSWHGCHRAFSQCVVA